MQRKKLWGTLFASPVLLCLSALTFSFLLTSLRPFSWLPWFLFSLSIVQSSSQRSFVAIVECIESLKNDVKQKMVDVSCSLSSTLAQKDVTKVTIGDSLDDAREKCSESLSPLT